MHEIFYYIICFVVLAGIAMGMANRKVDLPVRRQRWKKFLTYILITGTLIAGMFLDFFFLLAWIILLASWIELIKGNSQAIIKSSVKLSSYLILLIVGPGFILFAKSFSNPFILFIYFQVLVFDGFCQVTGQLLGKHLLVPGISPTKTWEGLAGGFLFCTAAGFLGSGWIQDGLAGRLMGIVTGLITASIAFTGDLLASYYKRKIAIKDYSDWLPGQGGFLDRFDSFLLVGAFYYVIYIFIPEKAISGIFIEA